MGRHRRREPRRLLHQGVRNTRSAPLLRSVANVRSPQLPLRQGLGPGHRRRHGQLRRPQDPCVSPPPNSVHIVRTIGFAQRGHFMRVAIPDPVVLCGWCDPRSNNHPPTSCAASLRSPGPSFCSLCSVRARLPLEGALLIAPLAGALHRLIFTNFPGSFAERVFVTPVLLQRTSTIFSPSAKPFRHSARICANLFSWRHDVRCVRGRHAERYISCPCSASARRYAAHQPWYVVPIASRDAQMSLTSCGRRHKSLGCLASCNVQPHLC